MYTNSTPNYHLPQYEATDKPAFLSDFNNAMDTIDTAIHENNVNTSAGSSELQNALIELNNTKEEVDTSIGQINQLKQQTENLAEEATNVTKNATDALNVATESKADSSQAVTIASQASNTANSALGVANNNYTEIQSLDVRVEALEGNPKSSYIISKTSKNVFTQIQTGGSTSGVVSFNTSEYEGYTNEFNNANVGVIVNSITINATQNVISNVSVNFSGSHSSNGTKVTLSINNWSQYATFTASVRTVLYL